MQRESNQRESTPGIRVWLRQTPLAPVLFRGSSRWAIPGPSLLVWHPCQTPLYTAPPLGLLTGFGDRVVWTICGRQSEKQSVNAKAKASRQIRRMGGAQRYPSSEQPDDSEPAVQHRSIKRAIPRSAGRAESLCKGVSRMDAAKGVKGQGRPLYAGPWNNDEVRGVSRSETRMPGRVSFAYFSLHEQRKVRRPRGRNTLDQTQPMRRPTSNPETQQQHGYRYARPILRNGNVVTIPRKQTGFFFPSSMAHT